MSNILKQADEINIPAIPRNIGFLETETGPVVTNFSGWPSGIIGVSFLKSSLAAKAIQPIDPTSKRKPNRRLRSTVNGNKLNNKT